MADASLDDAANTKPDVVLTAQQAGDLGSLQGHLRKIVIVERQVAAETALLDGLQEACSEGYSDGLDAQVERRLTAMKAEVEARSREVEFLWLRSFRFDSDAAVLAVSVMDADSLAALARANDNVDAGVAVAKRFVADRDGPTREALVAVAASAIDPDGSGAPASALGAGGLSGWLSRKRGAVGRFCRRVIGDTFDGLSSSLRPLFPRLASHAEALAVAAPAVGTAGLREVLRSKGLFWAADDPHVVALVRAMHRCKAAGVDPMASDPTAGDAHWRPVLATARSVADNPKLLSAVLIVSPSFGGRVVEWHEAAVAQQVPTAKPGVDGRIQPPDDDWLAEAARPKMPASAVPRAPETSAPGRDMLIDL